MGTRMIASVLVLLLFAGCTTTRPWQSTAGDPATLDAINGYGRKHEARVTLRDGSSFSARQLEVTAGEVRWIDPGSDEAKQVAVGEVREIDFTLPGRGAVQGAGFGLLGGGLAGFLLTVGSSGEYMGPAVVVAATLLFAVLGGCLTALGGADVGAHVIFQAVPSIDGQGSAAVPEFKLLAQRG